MCRNLEKLVKDLTASLEKTTKELDQKTSIVDNQQEQINTLNSIVTEYKSYKGMNKTLELANNDLHTQISNALHSNADLESRLENTENMKNFYKSEVDSLKNEVESLKAEIKELNKNIKEIDKANKEDIKAMEMAHKDELKGLEVEYKVEVSNLRIDLTEQFKEELISKIEIEKSKCQLEIDKAVNSEKLLQVKYDNLIAKQ